MDHVNNIISIHHQLAFGLGFALYAFFVLWRRLSIRWVNWFPLMAKLARYTMYAAAVGIVFLGISVIGSEEFQPNTWLLVAVGAFIAPAINTASRGFRKKEKVRRGTRVGEPSDVNRQTAAKLPREDFKDSFKIGGVTIPRTAEPYHFFVVGSTGSGKSVALTGLLDHIQARGDIALVVDSGGEYASRYYDPGRDAILNPFDDRCVPWSPTAEMAGPWDAEALAKSMIPDGVGESKEWNGYAQTLVTSTLRKLSEMNRLSIADLLYYVQDAPMSELEVFLNGTPAKAQLVSDKMFGSIRTIATRYLSTYAYLADAEKPFSISRFIQRGKPGTLFLTYKDAQLDSLQNMIACALDVAARTILDLSPNSARRVWLVIDEFASIGKVQSIEAVATKARKVGGCLVVGLQAVSQLKDRYGEHGAQTILSCLSSWLVLRCSDADTAEYISKYIGDTEISRMTRSESDSDTGGGSAGMNEQIQTQRAVMPVELQRLPNLQGFFKLAGDYPISNVKLSFPEKRNKLAQTYAPRDFAVKPMLSSKASVEAAQGAVAGGAAMAIVADAPAAAPVEQAQEVAAPVTTKIKLRENPLDGDPEAFEEALNDLADGLDAAM